MKKSPDRNILLIAYYYPPLNTGGVDRAAKIAKLLPRFGHRVTVLTHSYRKSDRGDAQVIRVYDPSYSRDHRGLRRWQWLPLRLLTEGLNRIGIYFSILTLWKRAVLRHSQRIIERVKPDLIMATYPPLETLEIALQLAQRYGLPLLADFRDGLLFEPVEKKRLEQLACLRRRFQITETQIAGRSDAITTVSPPISHYFQKKFRHPAVNTVSNGFDRDDFLNLPEPLGLERNAFNIVYTGSFALSEAGRSGDGLLKSLARLAEEKPKVSKKIRLHLIGHLRQNEVARLRNGPAGDRIVFHGIVDRPRALAFQKRADLLLLVTSPQSRSVATGKLFEYLCAGPPILALTGPSTAARIVKETRTGWVVSPDREKALFMLLKRLAANPSLLHSLKPDRKKIAAYSWIKQMAALDAIIRRIAAAGGAREAIPSGKHRRFDF